MATEEITQILQHSWDTIKDTIREESGITDISYRTWIEPLTFYEYKNNTVSVLIPSDNNIALSYIVNQTCYKRKKTWNAFQVFSIFPKSLEWIPNFSIFYMKLGFHS